MTLPWRANPHRTEHAADNSAAATSLHLRIPSADLIDYPVSSLLLCLAADTIRR